MLELNGSCFHVNVLEMVEEVPLGGGWSCCNVSDSHRDPLYRLDCSRMDSRRAPYMLSRVLFKTEQGCNQEFKLGGAQLFWARPTLPSFLLPSILLPPPALDVFRPRLTCPPSLPLTIKQVVWGSPPEFFKMFTLL